MTKTAIAATATIPRPIPAYMPAWFTSPVFGPTVLVVLSLLSAPGAGVVLGAGVSLGDGFSAMDTLAFAATSSASSADATAAFQGIIFYLNIICDFHDLSRLHILAGFQCESCRADA